ncbi:MAG: hypothetical protein AB7S68_37655 [Polyangiaceae bacterium]
MSAPLDRLTEFLRSHPSMPVGGAAADDPTLSEARAVAAGDPRLAAFLAALIDGDTSFCLFDVEFFPAVLGRGRRGEGWNTSGEVVAVDEVCLAKNGAGDLYIWSAASGQVCLKIHDEEWETQTTYADLDEFVVGVMDDCLERLTADDLEDPTEEYLSMLGFALEVGDAESISDEDVLERFEELGIA